MLTSATLFFASTVTHQVPDSGTTVALFTGTVLTLGMFARYMKNRKK